MFSTRIVVTEKIRQTSIVLGSLIALLVFFWLSLFPTYFYRIRSTIPDEFSSQDFYIRWLPVFMLMSFVGVGVFLNKKYPKAKRIVWIFTPFFLAWSGFLLWEVCGYMKEFGWWGGSVFWCVR